MTPTEAAKLLDLPDNATPEQIEARYHDLRARLEEKVVKAPTPGLKAKYRESLDAVTAAFETLTLAADGSALPVLKRESGEGRREQGRGVETGAAVTSPRKPGTPTQDAGPSAARKSGREFVVVAAIAVAVLGGGAWWLLKTRAEKAEQARLAAEAKAEADRQAAAEKAEADRRAAAERAEAERKAEEARLAAEARRKAEEEERARIAAAEKAEQERKERLTVAVRLQLAELKLGWDAFEQEGRDADQQVAEIKAEQRNLSVAAPTRVEELRARLGVAEAFSEWIQAYLLKHPARLLRIRSEELLASRLVDEASAEADKLRESLATLRPEIDGKRRALAATLHGSARLTLANRVDRWTLVDAFGQEFGGEGQEVVELPKVARGKAIVTLHRGEASQGFSVTVPPERTAEASLRFPESSITVAANVPNAEVFGRDGLIGVAPLTLPDQWPGTHEFEVRAPGYNPAKLTGTVVPGKILALTANLTEAIPSEEEIIKDFTTKAAGMWAFKNNGIASGYVKVVAGSARIDSFGKALLMKVQATGTISVIDRRQRTIRYVHDGAPQSTPETQLILKGEELIFKVAGKEYAYVRTDKNPF